MSDRAIGLSQRLDRRRTVLLGLIICLAFGLRLFRLNYQELRGDEAFDALFSAQPVSEILIQLQTHQPYPPLFHMGLHFWLDSVGQSETMQRLPALVAGVLLIPLIYQLAAMTVGSTTGLLAAALAAINPFLIWHAQDGRMYSLLAMLATASVWLGLRLLTERATWKAGLAYWIVTALAMLTHYFAWFLLLAENLAAVLVIWKENWERSRLARWFVWQLALALVLIAWIAFAFGMLAGHRSTWIPAYSPLAMVQRSLTAFSVGTTLPSPVALAFSIAFGLLFVLGCLYPSMPDARPFRFSGRILLLVFAGIPLLATMFLSIRRPAFDEKYLISMVPVFLILVAHGVHFLGAKAKLVAVVASVLILASAGWSLYNYFFGTTYAKSPNWRPLVEAIESRAQAGDVIIHNYPDPGLDYYYDGELPQYLLPRSTGEARRRTERTLTNLAADYGRVWFIPASGTAWDTEDIVAPWLADHADLVEEYSFGSLRLQLYETPVSFLERMETVGARLGEHIELLGYSLGTVAAKPSVAGKPLSLTLYWQAIEPVEETYTVFVHLADTREVMVGQHDGPPADGSRPTTTWEPGEIVVDQHVLEVSPVASAGTYRLMTGMYSSVSGKRLPIVASPGVLDDNRIVLTTLEIQSSGE
jgi:4-amino-4-deoxy-L-arabinose transferase-like glycosyltransferase